MGRTSNGICSSFHCQVMLHSLIQVMEEKPVPLADGIKDYLHFMNDWHNKGYWYPDNWSKFDESEVFRTCNMAMWSGWYSRVTIIVPKVVSNCPGMEYVRAPIMGQRLDGYY